MESVLGRYRNLTILVLVLFLQVLGLAVQVRTGTNEATDTRLIRIWAVGAITPFERALVWVQTSSNNLWHNYFYLRGVRAENRQLKAQIEQMRLEQVRLREDATQAHRLQMLLAFKEQFIAKTVAAQVIGTGGSDLSRVIYIDKGKNDGVDRDMAVITADGIVGKVLLVYPSLAQVLLISDESSGVGAILEKSRLQGVLRGTPNGEIVLERVMSDETVQPGEAVLTSGGDQIFPKGLPVGTVTKVGNGKELFLNIRIRPAAHLAKLEEVLVLTEKQERQAVAEDHGRVRAADILAQRLPSVPDKPAADATAAGVAGAAQQGASSPTAQNNANKPKGTAASTPSGAGKTAGTNPPQPAPRLPAQTASQSPVAEKPKPVNNPSAQVKSSAARTQISTQPPIVEQKPAPVGPPPASAPPHRTTAHNSVPITYTSGEQVEVYRFSLPVTIGVPLAALIIQAYVPKYFPGFAVYVDLPLLVTIFFAMARRSPIAGLFTGAFIGLAQDMLGHNLIGIYGIAKTVVGYGASSLGARLDLENAGARLLVTLGFYLVHSAMYFIVGRALVNMTQQWSWPHGILAGLVNGVIGVLLYFLLDRFKHRT